MQFAPYDSPEAQPELRFQASYAAISRAYDVAIEQARAGLAAAVAAREAFRSKVSRFPSELTRAGGDL